MPFCPICGDEFQDWVKTCPDDGVALVAKLPKIEKIKHPKSKLAYIATAPDEPIAKMWAGILEQNNIYCLLGTGSSPLTSGLQVFSVPVTIQVLATEAKRAKEVLLPFLES